MAARAETQAARANDQSPSAVSNALLGLALPRWLHILIAGAVVIGGISLLWRMLSRRRSLPCPPALIWPR